MTDRRLKVAMNGVTGRMGKNQHLVRSILAIREQGGLLLPTGELVQIDPLLLGRDARKMERLAGEVGVSDWSTDLDAALSDPDVAIVFDASSTKLRADFLNRAIAAGKAIYCEKPSAETFDDAKALFANAQAANVKHGVVQDKLWLPGLLRLRRLVESGFFGRILNVRIDFGYWVFPGHDVSAQRPSWNYRAGEGGGIILDMLPHWHYVIGNLFGTPTKLVCHGATHIGQRWDENGERYTSDADDAVYAIVETSDDIVVQINSSWCTRVQRDDLVTFHVDGTNGSAVAGLTDVRIQPGSATPKPVWNPDQKQTHDFSADWMLLPSVETFGNAFKAQWELFIAHVLIDTPFPWDLRTAAEGVGFAEAGHRSWRDRKWVDVPTVAVS